VINASDLHQHLLNILEQEMILIGFKEFFVAVGI
jgi:hypothetical protein